MYSDSLGNRKINFDRKKNIAGIQRAVVVTFCDNWGEFFDVVAVAPTSEE